ncbi:MAG TPA: glyoxalase superfamily protein [Hyphomicrobiaceae bacterium]|nr:glyoxalase superfamily protein [Hyphomicrobiaceae bacterium]
MQLRLDGARLHLSEHFGDAAPGSHVRIRCADVDAYCAALNAKAYKYFRPGAQDMP